VILLSKERRIEAHFAKSLDSKKKKRKKKLN